MIASSGKGKIRSKTLRFKNIDFTSTANGFEMLKPYNGLKFVPQRVLTYTRDTGGTISTQPQFKITDGTNDILAAAANMNANEGRFKQALITVDRPATYSAPLTLVITVAAAGTNPVFKGDIIVEGQLIG